MGKNLLLALSNDVMSILHPQYDPVSHRSVSRYTAVAPGMLMTFSRIPLIEERLDFKNKDVDRSITCVVRGRSMVEPWSDIDANAMDRCGIACLPIVVRHKDSS